MKSRDKKCFCIVYYPTETFKFMPYDYLFYLVSIVIISTFHVAVYLGVFDSIPEYIVMWYTIVQVFLCLVLMYRYHPFRTKFEYGEFDARLIFGASSILLSNIVTIPVLMKMVNPIQSMLLKNKIMSSVVVS